MFSPPSLLLWKVRAAYIPLLFTLKEEDATLQSLSHFWCRSLKQLDAFAKRTFIMTKTYYLQTELREKKNIFCDSFSFGFLKSEESFHFKKKSHKVVLGCTQHRWGKTAIKRNYRMINHYDPPLFSEGFFFPQKLLKYLIKAKCFKLRVAFQEGIPLPQVWLKKKQVSKINLNKSKEVDQSELLSFSARD